ncbi:signal peptidase II [uncultured Ruminococcus sp.]|uniref:signal peptidase II n=1 Tax=uncultured Ruminococcus sp. TaxID=165186 RepID=UPI00293015A8|nr:signal peptidase II [uncultured Ruminococcus sp.]
MIILYIAIIVIVPVLAEIIRSFILSGVKPVGTVTVIPGLFNLTYSENRGVAFGLFQDGTVFFAITTSIVIVAFLILLIKNYKKSKLFSVAAALIIGGGLGNLFERVFFGYVTDYLSLSFFSPICNFADYCITAGTVCLVVYLLFFSDFLKNDKKKTDEQA